MLIVGNSNVDCFRGASLRMPSEAESIAINWVGAIKAEHFFNNHPSGAKVRSLCSEEAGWKLFCIGTHDIFQLCMYASMRNVVDHFEEAFDTTFNLYVRIFSELSEDGRFAWVVFPQPLHQVSYKNFGANDILSVSRLFNKRIEAWCAENHVPVINPLMLITGEDGVPLKQYLQADGIHLNTEGTQFYLNEIEALTGVHVELTQHAYPFEPAFELESFCSLILNNMEMPWEALPAISDLQKSLSTFAMELLSKHGVEVAVDSETDLVGSGLLDSKNLKELHTFASQVMQINIPFDTNLFELSTVEKITAFLFEKKKKRAAVEGNWEIGQKDFVLSLRGNFSDVTQQREILGAEERIGKMCPKLYWAFEENMAVAGDGQASPYGIVFFWMALYQATQGKYIAAKKLLTLASDPGKRFCFRDPRVEYYGSLWSRLATTTPEGDAVPGVMGTAGYAKEFVWNELIEESILTIDDRKLYSKTSVEQDKVQSGESAAVQHTPAVRNVVFRESRLAHQWLDGLYGLEVGPSSHNPFGLCSRFVGLRQEGYEKEQIDLTGDFVRLDIVSRAEDIPVPDESEDYVLSSHVIEHCPDLVKTLVEWFRIIKPGGYLFMIVPHRNAAPVDVGRPLTEWQHVVDDYVRGVTEQTHDDVSMYGGGFGYCHYHVFDIDLMQNFVGRIFADRLQLVDAMPIDDKIGNGFTLVYRKTKPLSECFPWFMEDGAEIDVFSKPTSVSHQAEAEGDSDMQIVVAVNLVPFKDIEQRQRQDLCVASLKDLRTLGVIPLNICYRDEILRLEGWEVDPTLENSARDVLGVNDKRKPFVSELFQIAANWCLEHGIAYFALSNSDIIFTPGLIAEFRRLIQHGYDGAMVSRNEVERIDPVAGLVPGYLEVNGYDVFFCRADWWIQNRSRFQPYVYGARAWDDAYAAIMASHGKFHVLNVDGMCFHFKHATDWLGGTYAEFNLHLYNGVDKKYQDRYNSFIKEILRTPKISLASEIPRLLGKHFNLLKHDYLTSQEKRALQYVNIGMVTYNRLDFTKQCIDAFLRFTDYPYVLTVVDNFSQDGTREYLADLKAKGIVKNLVLLDENVGVAKASNIAWNLEPEASYYLKLDNDIVFQKPRWLSNMVAVIERIPEIGVLGYSFEPINYPVKSLHGVNVRVKERGNIGGACVLIPKRTHDVLGFWCEDYGLYGEEDLDYGVRVQLAGLLNAYMEDENIGFHLPAGKAAAINGFSLEAKDGLEEVHDKEYRLWKDEQRRKNIQGGTFEKNLHAYINKTKPLKVASSVMAGKSIEHDTPLVAGYVSIIICSIDDEKFSKVKLNYSALLAGHAFEIIRIDDAKSLCEGYNRGIDQSRGEILIFSHDDIEIIAPDFWQRLQKHLKSFDMVGIAGTTLMSGPLWGQSGAAFVHGLVIHRMNGNLQLNCFDIAYQNVCTPAAQAVDGVFFAVHRHVVDQVRFDQDTFDGFHLYDLDFSYRVYQAGFRIGICRDLPLIHDSLGGYNEVWEYYAFLFATKHKKFMPCLKGGAFVTHQINVGSKEEALAFVRSINGEISPNTELVQFMSADRMPVPGAFYKYWNWEDKTAISEVDAEIWANRMIKKWRSRSTFHLVIWLLPSEMSLLAETLDSLSQQLYGEWRLTVISAIPSNDPLWSGSPKLAWKACSPDSWVAMLNQTVQEENADWSILLPPGTRLEPHTLLCMADYANANPHWCAIYCDDDRIAVDGSHFDPQFKPDFNPDLLRSTPYIGESFFVRRDFFTESGGFENYPGWENHHLSLVASFALKRSQIGHVARILLHYPRKRKDWPQESNVGLNALQNVLQRMNIPATAEAGLGNLTFRVNYSYPGTPLVSILIPTRDKLEFLRPCVESVIGKTSYHNYEILIIDNQSQEPETLEWFAEVKEKYPSLVKVITYDAPFNFSAMINFAVRQANGEYVLLLNNDTLVVQDGWLGRMVSVGKRSDVGVVGCRLIYPETGKIQHAGIVLGFNDAAGHVFEGLGSIKYAGYMQRALCEQDYSAVTAAAMMVRRSIFESVGGMDEDQLAVLYNDVDFCLKVGKSGHLVVYTPHATLMHYAGQSMNDIRTMQDAQKVGVALERKERERRVFWKRWRDQIAHDPAWNVNLTLRGAEGAVEPVLAPAWDINFHDRSRILGVPLTGGSGEYRVISPLRALRTAGRAQVLVAYNDKMFQTRVIKEYELARLAPDTILMHAPLDDEQLSSLKSFIEYVPDILRVGTFDDLLTEVPEKNSFKKFGFRNIERRMREVVQLVERCVVTTEPLRDWLSSYGAKDVYVVPNRLELAKWGALKSQRGMGRRPRVGWAGAQQHQGDLELIEEVVRTLSNEVDWVFLGMCPEQLKPYISEFHDFERNFDHYPAKLASLNLDLALAPLEIHPFNIAKSNLRLLEYGIMGWPVVCTDIYPYQNAPVKRVPNVAQAWIEAIRERVNNLDAAYAEGDQLRQWVLDHYMLEDHLDEWMAALVRS